MRFTSSFYAANFEKKTSDDDDGLRACHAVVESLSFITVGRIGGKNRGMKDVLLVSLVNVIEEKHDTKGTVVAANKTTTATERAGSYAVVGCG